LRTLAIVYVAESDKSLPCSCELQVYTKTFFRHEIYDLSITINGDKKKQNRSQEKEGFHLENGVRQLVESLIVRLTLAQSTPARAVPS